MALGKLEENFNYSSKVPVSGEAIDKSTCSRSRVSITQESAILKLFF